MKEYIEERVLEVAQYIIDNKSTVRATARVFNVSKSTVHKDVSGRLEKIDFSLYKQVRDVLNVNKNERHLRGGIATKNKYLMQKHMCVPKKSE